MIIWSYQLQTLLEGQDLFGYLDGSFLCPTKFVITDDEGFTDEITTTYKEWKKTDKAILSLLIATLSFDTMDYVVGSKTSREAWMRLNDRYATFSRSHVMQLKTDLYTVTKGMDSVEKYLTKVTRARNQLDTLGVRMEDDDIVVVILNGLSAEFNLIKAIIRARESSVSIAELRILLLSAERDAANKAILNTTPAFSATRSRKNVSQRCLNDDGNMSENGRSYLNDLLLSPQYQHVGTSPPHTSPNHLQVIFPIRAMCDSLDTHIGISPDMVDVREQITVVDGGEENMINKDQADPNVSVLSPDLLQVTHPVSSASSNSCYTHIEVSPTVVEGEI